MALETESELRKQNQPKNEVDVQNTILHTLR